jgi:hypothetical protein
MQYLREAVQQLRHEGLTSVNLFQPSGSTALHWATTMWMYLGPSCPDCPFTDELGDAKINTRIHKVLAHGADLNPGAGPIEGRGRLHQGESTQTRFQLFVPISVSQCPKTLGRVSSVLVARYGGSLYLRTR